MKLSIDVTVINLVGNRHFAVTELGGIRVRGKAADNAPTAVRNLLWKLSGTDHDDDALLAVDLAAEGTSLDDRLEVARLSDVTEPAEREPTKEELLDEIKQLRGRERKR